MQKLEPKLQGISLTSYQPYIQLLNPLKKSLNFVVIDKEAISSALSTNSNNILVSVILVAITIIGRERKNAQRI